MTTKRGKLCRLVTLGCKVNQYETQYVKETLQAGGWHEAESDEFADLCVVNTCTVTAEGDAKSRQAVRRLHRRNPHAAILVMGCYATRDPEAVAKLPGVVQVVTDKSKLEHELKPYGVTHIPRGIQRFDGHSRAFLKVQDGCLLNCSYCIIPTVRPHLISRDLDEIVAEVEQLIASGFQEIVLTGVHLGHYGIDRCKGKPKSEWRRLWHLLRRLGELPGNFRIRLSSLEAAEARDDLVKAIAEIPKIVPHLHLCLQSGSDRILRQMKRRYTAGGFLARVERLRNVLDTPAFTTDVIVGFPGETDADFAETCRVAREVGFSKIHIFPYSSRQGTEAAHFAEPVPPQKIAERRQTLQALEKELAATYHQRLLGRRLEVLVENAATRRADHVIGTSCRYAPVVFPGHKDTLLGRLVPVVAERIEGDRIIGKPVPDLSLQPVVDVEPNKKKRLRMPLALIP